MNNLEHSALLKAVGGDSVRLDVFYYILEHMDRKTKIYHGSYESVSRGLGVSLSAVIAAMKKMQAVNYLRLIKNGQWQITDNVKIYAENENPDECENMVPVKFQNFGE